MFLFVEPADAEAQRGRPFWHRGIPQRAHKETGIKKPFPQRYGPLLVPDHDLNYWRLGAARKQAGLHQQMPDEGDLSVEFRTE